MRFLVIVVIIRWFLACISWFLRLCFQIGYRLGSAVVWLFKRKKPLPQVDPTLNADGVKPLRDE